MPDLSDGLQQPIPAMQAGVNEYLVTSSPDAKFDKILALPLDQMHPALQALSDEERREYSLFVNSQFEITRQGIGVYNLQFHNI